MKLKYTALTISFIVAIMLAVFLTPFGPHTVLFVGAAVAVCPLVYFAISKILNDKTVYRYFISFFFIIIFSITFYILHYHSDIGFFDLKNPPVIEHTIDTSASKNDRYQKTVYKTPSGKRYHMSKSCAGSSSYEIDKNIAIDEGLTPCQKCCE